MRRCGIVTRGREPGEEARAYLDPPERPGPLFGPLLRIVRAKVDASQSRVISLLAWHPRAAIGAVLLEASAIRPVGTVDARMLKLVRLTISFALTCPFCVGLNARGWERLLSADEFAVTQGLRPPDDVPTLSRTERLAIEFARRSVTAPPEFTADFGPRLRAEFTEREIVALSTVCAQVNYWSRLVQGLGADPG